MKKDNKPYDTAFKDLAEQDPELLLLLVGALVFLPAGMPDAPLTTVTMQAGGFVITITYTVVKFWEMSAKWALALGRESLLPFVPLMSGGLEEMEQSAMAINQIDNPTRRQELALHFVMLGGLRYNQEDLLNLLGRIPMIPMEIYRESSFYQMAVKEGRQEGRQEGRARLSNLFLALAQRRFPGANLMAEIERVHDLDALEQLCLSLDQFSSIEALRARLAELAVKPS